MFENYICKLEETISEIERGGKSKSLNPYSVSAGVGVT